jgi:hypothetical protein
MEGPGRKRFSLSNILENYAELVNTCAREDRLEVNKRRRKINDIELY